MNTYTRLAFWEREEISRGLAQNISFEEIAEVLGRNPSMGWKKPNEVFQKIALGI